MTCLTAIASKTRLASTLIALLATACATSNPPVVDAEVLRAAGGSE